MSNKNYSVILTVDLSCSRCQEKVKKILNKHRDRWNIQSVVWDEKINKITVTGHFCPHKLAKRLCRKAPKVIEAIDIPDTCECEEKPKPKPVDPPPPPPPAASKPTPPPPSPPAPKTETPKPAPALPPPDQEPPKQAPAPSPPKPQPVEPDVDPVASVPYPPVWPVCFCGPCCMCGSSSGYGPCSCGSGGDCRFAGDLGYGRPCLDGGGTKDFFCEEDSACRPM